jgi:hypothetical protein
VKITGPGSTAAGFLVESPAEERVLVTAGHVLSALKADECIVILHRRQEDGTIVKNPQKLAVRQGGTPLWQKHPAADVAAIRVPFGKDDNLAYLPIGCLARAEDLLQLPLQPGTLVRLWGFPHAPIFQGNPEEYGIVRLGCVANYPLPPERGLATFLIDINTFEGDSGGPVAVLVQEVTGRPAVGDGSAPAGWVIGLMTGQHFVDEEFRMIYQSGKFRHRMGLGIVVASPLIREVIGQVLKGPPGESPPM